MAKLKQGILGHFLGKVGNIIGSTRNGTPYMKTRASKFKDSKTLKQKIQRDKFKLAQIALQPITPFLRKGFKFELKQRTAFNSAMSHAIKNAIMGEYPNIYIDYTKLLVSHGNHTGIIMPQVGVMLDRIILSWKDNSNIAKAQPSDKIMVLAINPAKKESVHIAEGALRSAKREELLFPSHWGGDKLEVYAAFMARNGKSISASTHCGSVVVC